MYNQKAAKDYYDRNKELVKAKSHLRYTIRRYLGKTTAFDTSYTQEDMEKQLTKMTALMYNTEIRNLHTVADIKNRIKQLQLEILDKYVDCASASAKENIDDKKQKPEKDGLTSKEQHKRDYYLKNRDKCIAYSMCYASEKKKLLKEARLKEDTEEFDIELKKRIQDKLKDYMDKEHRPYNAFTKKRRGVKPYRKTTKTVNNVTATTAEVSGDTAITISGDVVITPEIKVTPTDAPIKITPNAPTEVVVMFKEPFFILFIISMIMSISTLIAMFLYK